MVIISIFALAVAIDLALGDPPNVVHPVAWMGKAIAFLAKGGLKLRPGGQFAYGLGMTLFMMALGVIPVYFIVLYAFRFNIIAGIVISALIFKSTFSITGMRRAARQINKLLKSDRLKEARFEMRALVSRDTADLPGPLLASGAVESVAEGTCDSLAAPMFYFLLLGAPGAIGYRAVNTLDAMVGYHGRYEYLGKFAARLDDVLNFIPARLAALALIAAAALRQRGRAAWRAAFREHKRTASPNAGWPIAAMAGAMGNRLEKTGHYTFQENLELPSATTIDSAVGLFLTAAAIWTLLCLLEEVVRLAIIA